MQLLFTDTNTLARAQPAWEIGTEQIQKTDVTANCYNKDVVGKHNGWKQEEDYPEVGEPYSKVNKAE